MLQGGSLPNLKEMGGGADEYIRGFDPVPAFSWRNHSARLVDISAFLA